MIPLCGSNGETELDMYPMPRINDILDQVPVVEEDRQKTAFVTTKGLYQFKMMPFGLCGAPATFQRMMDQVITRTTCHQGRPFD